MTTGPDRPLLLCYDGSADAKHAIERAGLLFNGAHALVLTVPATRTLTRTEHSAAHEE